MPNLNQVNLIGHVTRDPQLSRLPSNMPVCDFGLAINRSWKNKETGEQQKETCFVDCTCFAKQAEIFNQYVHKGDPVYVSGRLKLDQWQDREGNKRSKLKVVVTDFQFLKPKDGGEQQQPINYAPPKQQPQQSQPAPYPDDDLPF